MTLGTGLGAREIARAARTRSVDEREPEPRRDPPRPWPDGENAIDPIRPGEVRLLARGDRLAQHLPPPNLPDGIRAHELSLGRAILAHAMGDGIRNTKNHLSTKPEGKAVTDELMDEIVRLRAQNRLVVAGQQVDGHLAVCSSKRPTG